MMVKTYGEDGIVWSMDEGTIKTPFPKCRLYWCLIEFIDWRHSQSCWYFDPSCELLPLYLLSDLPQPSSPFPKSTYIIYRQCVAVGGGVGRRWRGVLSCVVDHILQKFSTLFLTRFRVYKIATPPNKTPVKTTFRNWCLNSSFVHGVEYEGGWGQIC
jgi:hypothetical protein